MIIKKKKKKIYPVLRVLILKEREVLYVQEVLAILYSNLLYQRGHYFLDRQYNKSLSE